MLQAVYSLASGSHLYSGSQTVDYVANLTHNASVLICQVTAANHSHYLVILVNKTYSGLCQTGPVGHGKGKNARIIGWGIRFKLQMLCWTSSNGGL